MAKAKTNKPTTTEEGTVKEKYATMLVGIGKTHEAEHEQLIALADRLGVKPGAIVWAAVRSVLALGVTSADQLGITVTQSKASVAVVAAKGFWVVPVKEGDRAVSVRIIEVSRRDAVTDGREFYRYSEVDGDATATAKNRARAKAQAIRGAKADLKFLGVDGEPSIDLLAE